MKEKHGRSLMKMIVFIINCEGRHLLAGIPQAAASASPSACL